MYGYGYRYNSGLVVGAGGGSPFLNTYSLEFDGVDDFVIAPLDGTTTGGILPSNSSDIDLTISIWFNKTTNTSMFQWADRLTSGIPFILIAGTSSGYRILINNGYQFDAVISSGTWVNVVIVRNSATNVWTHYLNGVAIQTYNDGGTLARRLNATDIYLGNGYSSYFNGLIDEVSIWNTDQSANIATLSASPTEDLTSLSPTVWLRNGDNGAYKSPQWLIPSNENKDKVSNYSMDFDGTDQYLNIGAPSVLSNTSNFSISCWVKQTTSAINYRRVFGRLASASDMILLGTTTTTNNFIFYIENGGSYSFVESNVGIGFDVWKHVTLVFDGTLTGNQNRAKIYVDGVNVTATDSGTIPATTTADASDFYLGKVNGLGSFYYYGNMDEFAIFDYSLTPAEVLSISSEPTVLTSLSPTSWLKLGDNSTFAGGVWTVVDEVGTNDGSSVNMDIEDRIGEAPNSTNNALSSNMDFVDVVPDTP